MPDNLSWLSLGRDMRIDNILLKSDASFMSIEGLLASVEYLKCSIGVQINTDFSAIVRHSERCVSLSMVYGVVVSQLVAIVPLVLCLSCAGGPGKSPSAEEPIARSPSISEPILQEGEAPAPTESEQAVAPSKAKLETLAPSPEIDCSEVGEVRVLIVKWWTFAGEGATTETRYDLDGKVVAIHEADTGAGVETQVVRSSLRVDANEVRCIAAEIHAANMDLVSESVQQQERSWQPDGTTLHVETRAGVLVSANEATDKKLVIFAQRLDAISRNAER